MPGAVLEVAVTEKRYGAAAVLRDVRFSLRAGEVAALFGPSGAGKTTLLRIVLGLDHAFGGHVRRPRERPAVAFQEPRLAPWLTVAQNLRLLRPDLGDAEIGALLAQFGLPGVAGMLPGALSLGMARRVALARALAVRSGWMVLDEPFASLDPGLGAAVAATTLRRARDAGATVLLASHLPRQVLALADRALVLAGTPATLALDLAIGPAGPEAAHQALVGRFPFLAAGIDSPAITHREETA